MKKIIHNSGWLPVNKPEGVESFGIIRELKFRFQFSKIGFAGTLDPLASGLLLIAINKATKLIPQIHSLTKKYQVKIFFGSETKTQDIEGRYINYKKVNHNYEQRIKILNNFIGSFRQKIPIFSAHKSKGKNLYQLARKNELVEEKFKEVTVHSLKIKHQDAHSIDFIIECNAGFYVRSFAQEFAKNLGEFGVAMNIIRSEIGQFKLSESIDFQNILDFSDINDLDNKIIPIYSGRHPG